MEPVEHLMQMIHGYWASQVVSVATRLDLLQGLAEQPKSFQQLAQEQDCHPESVLRLLRACSLLNLCQEEPLETFQLTPLGRLLTAQHPQSLRDTAIMAADPAHWTSWAELESTVRTGQAGYRRALGVDNVFDYLAQHPAESQRFDRAMASMTGALVHHLRAAYPVADFPVVVDVGGGHGQLLGALLAEAPQSRGILFDQAPVLQHADPHLAKLGCLERVSKVSGSFFERVPAGGDLYLLKHILHDWTDDQCRVILGRLAAALKPSSRVLIAEMLLPQPPQVAATLLMDLNMMVMTGGRERSLAQFADLLESAGLSLLRHLPLPGPIQLLEAALPS